MVAQHARRSLSRTSPDLVDKVAAYRAGYLARERRALEQDLTEGRLLGVAATNALELGIDVGGLDAVVLNGFPGTLASLWQQAGRAGRTSRRSAAVLVAGDDQLDQWYVAHPDELTGRAPDAPW
ncbi:MAG: helicase-related protein [Acidimicrobiia bacterium]|nr:helicase-related protein [Acidimicrobiia bacterium]